MEMGETARLRLVRRELTPGMCNRFYTSKGHVNREERPSRRPFLSLHPRNLGIAGGTGLLSTSTGPRTDAGNHNITSVSVYIWIHEDTGNKPRRPDGPGREEDKRGGVSNDGPNEGRTSLETGDTRSERVREG